MDNYFFFTSMFYMEKTNSKCLADNLVTITNKMQGFIFISFCFRIYNGVLKLNHLFAIQNLSNRHNSNCKGKRLMKLIAF